MDAVDFFSGGLILAVLVFLVGIGWLISRDQDDAQQRAIACIEAGRQFVSGDCVAGPTP